MRQTTSNFTPNHSHLLSNDFILNNNCFLGSYIFRLSNGYIIKIGRGLHYFLPADKFCLGQYNYDFRKCKETNIDIFYCPENKTS